MPCPCEFCSCCRHSWFWIMTKGCFWIRVHWVAPLIMAAWCTTVMQNIDVPSSSGLYEDGNALKMSETLRLPCAGCYPLNANSNQNWNGIAACCSTEQLTVNGGLPNRDLGHHALSKKELWPSHGQGPFSPEDICGYWTPLGYMVEPTYKQMNSPIVYSRIHRIL